MAHVNELGESIPISVRGDHPALRKLDAKEARDFTYQEGAFYGDVFRSEPKMYACVGRDGQGAYGSHSPYLASRLCVTGTPIGQKSPCGFVNAGPCEFVCDSHISTSRGFGNEAWDDCATRLGRDDDDYPNTVTIFLGSTR